MNGRRKPFGAVGVAEAATAILEAAAASIVCASGPCAYAETPATPPAVAPASSAVAPTLSAVSPPPPNAAAIPPNPNSDCPADPTQLTRRRPGHTPRDHDEVECDPNRLPTPDTAALPGPAAQDRWRVIDQIGVPATLVNPYATNNLLKGDRPLLDRPIFGGNWFFNGTATSNTLLESRRIPVSAVQGTPFLDPRQQQFNSQTLSIDTVLYRGDTIFQPPDLQFRFTPTFNYSSTHTNGQQVSTNTFGAQALFVEEHLRDVSANYDFDSVRVGIQAVNSDFRGFILADQPVGIRVFGTRDNDVYQYNVGVFRPLPKNAARQAEFGAGFPDNDIVLANLYVQDLFRPGLTSEFLFLYNRNRAPGTEIVADKANLGAAPATFVNGTRHNYDVAYLGYSVDGHVGKVNLTGSHYQVLGLEEASEFGAQHTRVQANFAAVELSRDFDWIRIRASGLYASGDSDPLDKTAHGFDGLSQSALFAGADSSFFIHQQLPLAASQINLKVRDSLFPDLRSSAAPGESNYENPGLRLVGLGADLDFSPALRLSLDANHLWFDQTATLAAVLGRSLPSRDLGTDLSFDLFYRPLDSQNVILRLTAARLLTAPATRALTGGNAPFSAFFNLILTY
jgi:hypothetical protein